MFPEIGRSLHDRLAADGIPVLLAGGWAVGHFGHQRFTRDLDWVCSRRYEARVKALMGSLGFSMEFESMATRFIYRKDPSVIPIDFIWVDDESFTKMGATLERTTERKDIPVVDFIALLAMKISAFENGKNRGYRDLLDVRMLLDYNPDAISEEQLRELCDRYGGPSAYAELRPDS